MIPSALMSFLHFLDYGVNLFLFGFIFFTLIIKRGSLNKKWLYFGFSAGLFTSLVWMFASSVDMADGWDSQAIWYAMSKTEFAHWWCYRLLLLLGGLILTSLANRFKFSPYCLLLISAVIPIFSSLTSHAGTSETYRTGRIALDYIHFSAASIWGGGLLGIFIFLNQIKKTQKFQPSDVYGTVKRFSHFAMVSTGILMASGLVQVYLIEKSLTALWLSSYGKLIFLKLFLFCTALLAAALNQFVHMKKFEAGKELQFATAVRREVGLEILIIIGILGVTSFLTRTNLPEM